MADTATLRFRLSRKPIVVAPGVYDAFSALLASRMAFDAYGSTDLFAVGIFALALVIGYIMGGFSTKYCRGWNRS